MHKLLTFLIVKLLIFVSMPVQCVENEISKISFVREANIYPDGGSVSIKVIYDNGVCQKIYLDNSLNNRSGLMKLSINGSEIKIGSSIEYLLLSRLHTWLLTFYSVETLQEIHSRLGILDRNSGKKNSDYNAVTALVLLNMVCQNRIETYNNYRGICK